MAAPMCDASWRSRSGFSILELLIVVAVLAIMALIVVPTADSSRETALRMAARLIVADIEYTQSASIGNGEDPCVLVFQLADNEYSIARRSDPGTPITDPGSHKPYTTSFGQGRGARFPDVMIDGIDVGGDDQLGFTALGVPDQGTDATITLRSGSFTLQVKVDAATGEAAVE